MSRDGEAGITAWVYLPRQHTDQSPQKPSKIRKTVVPPIHHPQGSLYDFSFPGNPPEKIALCNHTILEHCAAIWPSPLGGHGIRLCSQNPQNVSPKQPEDLWLDFLLWIGLWEQPETNSAYICQ